MEIAHSVSYAIARICPTGGMKRGVFLFYDRLFQSDHSRTPYPEGRMENDIAMIPVFLFVPYGSGIHWPGKSLHRILPPRKTRPRTKHAPLIPDYRIDYRAFVFDTPRCAEETERLSRLIGELPRFYRNVLFVIFTAVLAVLLNAIHRLVRHTL